MTHTRSKHLAHGACRMSNMGFPTSAILDEVTRKTGKAEMAGATKATSLNADECCRSTITFSARDQKPVHFLSTAMDSISWETYTKKIHGVSLNKKINLTFLRTNA